MRIPVGILNLRTLRCWLSFERLGLRGWFWGSWAGWGWICCWGVGGKFFLRLTSRLRGPTCSHQGGSSIKTFLSGICGSLFFFAHLLCSQQIDYGEKSKEGDEVDSGGAHLTVSVPLCWCPLPSVPCRWLVSHHLCPCLEGLPCLLPAPCFACPPGVKIVPTAVLRRLRLLPPTNQPTTLQCTAPPRVPLVFFTPTM